MANQSPRLDRKEQALSGSRAAAAQQGTARVSFALDRKGMVANARVIESSGSSALDEEAVALLKRAEPFPAPPANFPGDSLS